jgi:hypothetical protein
VDAEFVNQLHGNFEELSNTLPDEFESGLEYDIDLADIDGISWVRVD